MLRLKYKQIVVVALLLLPLAWCYAHNTYLKDGHSNIPIMASNVQGAPKTSSIQASIDGHFLSVVFLENLGQVTVEVSFANGGEIETQSTPTPNGVIIYIPTAGSYIVTFTLANGDVYYGEFEVTD